MTQAEALKLAQAFAADFDELCCRYGVSATCTDLGGFEGRIELGSGVAGAIGVEVRCGHETVTIVAGARPAAPPAPAVSPGKDYMRVLRSVSAETVNPQPALGWDLVAAIHVGGNGVVEYWRRAKPEPLPPKGAR